MKDRHAHAVDRRQVDLIALAPRSASVNTQAIGSRITASSSARSTRPQVALGSALSLAPRLRARRDCRAARAAGEGREDVAGARRGARVGLVRTA